MSDEFNPGLPEGCDHHFQPVGERDFLLVDSQELAVVDLKAVDDIVEAARPYFTGERYLDEGFILLEQGALVSTWEDAEWGYTAHAKSGAIQAFEMDYSWEDDVYPAPHWFEAGSFHAPSGILVIGDPGQLEDYVEDPFRAPFESFYIWALVTLPGPGRVTVYIRRSSRDSEARNIGMRWEWTGAESHADWRRRVTTEPV